MGFGVRKSYTNKSKKDGSIMTVRFVCNKEGLRGKDKRDHLTKNPRRETRTDCKVRIGLTHVDGIFRIYDFIEDHNHVLQTPKTTHMLASQRKISKVQALEIELAEDSGLQLRTSYELSSRHAGGKDNLGYTRLDQKNYLRTIRKRSLMYGEAGWLLRYFKKQNLKNPSYYHDYQMDSEEQITNIFWADPKMLLDYSYFGDVVSLDTTYCINNAHRPLAIFSGFNHFRGVVIFGAALLYDETASSFKWLFKTFLEANLQKKPQTIFTDQDQAMAKALHEVMPEVLEVNGVMTIPDQYILKRLTKDARSGAIEDVNGNKVVEDPDSVGTIRHRQLWPKLVKLASDVSNSEQAFLLDNEAVNQVNFEVPKIYGNQVNFETPQGSSNQMNFEVPPNLGTQFSFTKFLMEPFSTQSLEGSEFYGDFSNVNDQS
ncbi:protein FAR1-RELATED SEQUENCE 5-like [Senna tora]|uniref:Protein FAR1-RELATED SEQUENCE 5-like n=1 Tax=Senna tora TaxID=362788 RepID=A0A835CM57_9FABA|nr:protein FAR1-RELATED SEQUENCE 5-like [Senna tora]